jgi:hypothetical protein
VKKLIILLSAMLVGGCTTVPVKRNFPEAPPELKAACPALKTLDPNTTKLSVVIESVSDNYATYHECRVKMNEWIVWYNKNKEIFDSVK